MGFLVVKIKVKYADDSEPEELVRKFSCSPHQTPAYMQ